MESNFLDYFFFILLALGVVALGAHDLYEKHGGKIKVSQTRSGKRVFRQLLEDRSASFHRGNIPDRAALRESDGWGFNSSTSRSASRSTSPVTSQRQRAQYKWGSSELNKMTDILINDPGKEFDRKSYRE